MSRATRRLKHVKEYQFVYEAMLMLAIVVAAFVMGACSIVIYDTYMGHVC